MFDNGSAGQVGVEIVNIGEKWKRLARELFEFYSEQMVQNGFTVNDVLTPWDAQKIQELYKFGVKEGEIRELISFSISHWDQLRDYDSDGKRLSGTPSFNELFAPWRFSKWIKLARDGFPINKPKVSEAFSKWTSNEGKS